MFVVATAKFLDHTFCRLSVQSLPQTSVVSFQWLYFLLAVASTFVCEVHALHISFLLFFMAT